MNYLTESRLGHLLSAQTEVVPQFKLERYRVDFILPRQNVLLEFDGFRHYQDPAVIERDSKVNAIAEGEGYTLIRIPYFVQWCSSVAKRVGLRGPIRPSYPHGFIDPKALLPAAFCLRGLTRFQWDLQQFPELKDEILGSLCSVDAPPEIVFPNQAWKKISEQCIRRIDRRKA